MKTKEYNKQLLEKYPWLTPSNRFSGKRITDCMGQNGELGYWPSEPDSHPDYDYSYTEADLFGEIWWDTFGEKMVEEVDQILKTWPKKDYNDFRVLDIKEKFGYLRFYTNFTTDELENVISKYEDISKTVCCKCGKPSTKVSHGWISYYCDEHAPSCSSDISETDF